MRQALALAARAAAEGEVPIGALIVHGEQVVGTGYNLRETHKNALRHAEIDAIGAACAALGAWRLSGCELFVTLEPCLMCAGAIYQARIERVVFGAYDPKAGAMGSLYKVHEDARLNHRLPVVSGVLEAECGQLLKDFFKARRTRP
jgi:tRNA(adenine34) deaminase